MNVFSTAHRRRTTAFVVLLLWVFSVAAGIVNACVLDAPRASTGHTNEAPASVAVVLSLVASHDRAILGSGDDSDGSGAPCLKICDNNSKSLPKPQSATDQIDLTQMPPPSAFWPVAEQTVLVTDQFGRMPPPASAVPIRTHLARLAL